MAKCELVWIQETLWQYLLILTSPKQDSKCNQQTGTQLSVTRSYKILQTKLKNFKQNMVSDNFPTAYLIM